LSTADQGPDDKRTSDDAGATSTTRGRGALALKWAFLTLGAIGLAIALRSSWSRAGDVTLPGLGALVVSGTLSAAGIAALGALWLLTLGIHRHRAALLRSFYLSQLGKYIPGGVWQPLGQIGLAIGHDVPARRAWSRFIGFSVMLVVGSGLAAAPLVVAPGVSGWARVAGALASLTLLTTLPPATHLVETTLSRVARRQVDELLPAVGRPLLVGVAVAAMFIYSVGFALLLVTTTDVTPVAASSAFALAWLVGYLALPVPAGLGIREAVLVAVLSPHVDAGEVLAAAVAYRLVSIAGEGILCVLASAWVTVLRGRRDTARLE